MPESDFGMPFGVILEHVIQILLYTLLKKEGVKHACKK